MSQTDSAEIDPFSVTQLEGKVFRWVDTAKVTTKTRSGGVYDAPCILADIKGYVTPIWVKMPTLDYENLRLIRLQTKAVAFSCTVGAKPEKGYAPRIFAGAADW